LYQPHFFKQAAFNVASIVDKDVNMPIYIPCRFRYLIQLLLGRRNIQLQHGSTSFLERGQAFSATNALTRPSSGYYPVTLAQSQIAQSQGLVIGPTLFKTAFTIASPMPEEQPVTNHVN
jgi:hypothetical protein